MKLFLRNISFFAIHLFIFSKLTAQDKYQVYVINNSDFKIICEPRAEKGGGIYTKYTTSLNNWQKYLFGIEQNKSPFPKGVEGTIRFKLDDLKFSGYAEVYFNNPVIGSSSFSITHVDWPFTVEQVDANTNIDVLHKTYDVAAVKIKVDTTNYGKSIPGKFKVSGKITPVTSKANDNNNAKKKPPQAKNDDDDNDDDENDDADKKESKKEAVNPTKFPAGETDYSCHTISITGPDDYNVVLYYDQDERLTQIAGIDADEGPKNIKLIMDKKRPFPVPAGQKGFQWNSSAADNYMLTTTGTDENDQTIQFRFNKEGKIVSMQHSHNDGSTKNVKYYYDDNGDLASMDWEGTMSSGVTDKGVLKGVFDAGKPDVIMKGGPMLFLVESAWQMFPMTNSHRIISFSYTQTIHSPERKIELDNKDADGNPVFKTIPEKNITQTITRNFSYTYDNIGRPASVTVKGQGRSRTYKIVYNNCK